MKDVYNHDIRYKSLLREIKTFNTERKNTFIKYNRFCVTRNLSIARKITLLNCLKAFLMDANLKKPKIDEILNIWFKKRKEFEKLKEKN